MLNHETANYIHHNKDVLAYEIATALAVEYKDFLTKFNMDKQTLVDYAYHDLSKLYIAILSSRPKVFAQYIIWERSVMESRSIPLVVTQKSMELLSHVVKKHLSMDMWQEAKKSIEAGMQELKENIEKPMPFLQKSMPYYDLAQHYLELLLQSERDEAINFIFKEVKTKLDIRDIYLHIFQPVQYEVGRLWQLNKISVAKEHYATATTYHIISNLRSEIKKTPKQNKRIVTTCIGRELHDIGIRLVTDFFEMSHWQSYYIGANVPVYTIIEAIEEFKPHILAISVTMTVNLTLTKNLITQIRDSVYGSIYILVGGYSFNNSPALWKVLNANGYAPDAQKAVEIAEKYMSTA